MTTTALQEAPAQTGLAKALADRGIDGAAWNTLTGSLYPGAKPESVLMVLDYCRARRLDPLKKPCHIVPIWVKGANGEQGSVRDVVMAGIYEYRTTAQRTGEYRGHTAPEFGPDFDYLGVKAPEWCALTVLRGPRGETSDEFPVKVYFREACGLDRNGKPNDRWKKAPIQMLEKCFDEKTEVLTERGFRRFADVDGARVLQVTTDGRLEPVAATPFVQPYDGAMVTMDGDHLNFKVTPNHDMVTTHGRIEAGAMYEQARTRPKFWIPRLLHGSNPDAPMSDAGLRLAAAYLADGSDHSGGNVFAIEVSRPRKVAALRALNLHSGEGVGSVAGTVSRTATREIVTKHTQSRFSYGLILVAPLALPGKRVAVDFLLSLSRRQARVFVDSLIEFDGHVDPVSGVRRFYTSRLSHLQAFEMACVVAGYSVSAPTARMSDIGTTPNYVVTVSDRDAMGVRRVGRKVHRTVAAQTGRDYLGLTLNTTGSVWCVTVPSGVIVVRRHGFSMLCGNCAEAAALRKAFPDEFGGEATAEEMDGNGGPIDITPIAMPKATGPAAATAPATSQAEPPKAQAPPAEPKPETPAGPGVEFRRDAVRVTGMDARAGKPKVNPETGEETPGRPFALVTLSTGEQFQCWHQNLNVSLEAWWKAKTLLDVDCKTNAKPNFAHYIEKAAAVMS